MVIQSKEELAQIESEHRLRLLNAAKKSPEVILRSDGKNQKLRDFDLVTTTVKIRSDQVVWLKNHEDVNLSGLIRQTIDQLMNN